MTRITCEHANSYFLFTTKFSCSLITTETKHYVVKNVAKLDPLFEELRSVMMALFGLMATSRI